MLVARAPFSRTRRAVETIIRSRVVMRYAILHNAATQSKPISGGSGRYVVAFLGHLGQGALVVVRHDLHEALERRGPVREELLGHRGSGPLEVLGDELEQRVLVL